jgi:hypothetical protein
MNYRCTFSIEIRKNLINAGAPVILQTEHKTQTLFGQFSFGKNNISAFDKKGVKFNKTTGKKTTTFSRSRKEGSKG